MSQRSQTLRALVTERLTAAAEEIFVLVERTIAEYEEELCRSKEENQRKRQLLDSALGPQLHRTADAQTEWSLEPGLKRETLQIKEEPEEQSVKQEEEQLQINKVGSLCDVSCPETRKEFTEKENVTSQPTDMSSLLRRRAAQKNTEDRDKNSGADTDGHTSRRAARQRKKHQCSVCQKIFIKKEHLRAHTRIHTGEKPFRCTVCERVFNQKSNLTVHMRKHTREKPFTCAVCKTAFRHKISLNAHMRLHSSERPYSYSLCEKTFSQKYILRIHTRTHKGEKPFTCSVCKEEFSKECNLRVHLSTHIYP